MRSVTLGNGESVLVSGAQGRTGAPGYARWSGYVTSARPIEDYAPTVTYRRVNVSRQYGSALQATDTLPRYGELYGTPYAVRADGSVLYDAPWSRALARDLGIKAQRKDVARKRVDDGGMIVDVRASRLFADSPDVTEDGTYRERVTQGGTVATDTVDARMMARLARIGRPSLTRAYVAHYWARRRALLLGRAANYAPVVHTSHGATCRYCAR